MSAAQAPSLAEPAVALRAALMRLRARLDARLVLVALLLLAVVLLGDLLRFSMAPEFPRFGRPEYYWWAVLAVECVYVPVLIAAVLVADQCVEQRVAPAVAYTLAVVVATALAMHGAAALRHALGLHLRAEADPDPALASMAPVSMFFDMGLRTAILVFAYAATRRFLMRREQARRGEREREELRRETVALQLRAVQARVDPRFLLDTMGDVATRMAEDAPGAARLLDALIDYLRAAVPNVAQPTSTIAGELALARAWLAVQHARGVATCPLVVHVDDGARDAALPAMLLPPLVAGTAGARAPHDAPPVALDVHRRGATLSLRIAVAEVAAPALAAVAATLRERTAALYGGAERLTLATAQAGGATLQLDLPA